MDYDIDFDELEIVLGYKVKSHSDGYSEIIIKTASGQDKTIRKEILVFKYLDYITEKLNKEISLKLNYRSKWHSNGCQSHISNSGCRSSCSGGTQKTNMILTSLKGIIKNEHRKLDKEKNELLMLYKCGIEGNEI